MVLIAMNAVRWVKYVVCNPLRAFIKPVIACKSRRVERVVHARHTVDRRRLAVLIKHICEYAIDLLYRIVGLLKLSNSLSYDLVVIEILLNLHVLRSCI